jgi:WD40 repeat protein
LNTGTQAAVFSVDGYHVGLAYSAKAGLAATYTWSRIRLWDLETGKEVRKWKGRGNDFTRVCFSPDGKRLLTSGLEGTIQIWDVESGTAHEEVTFDGGGGWCAAYSPDGRRIVSGGGRFVRLWDAESGKELRKYEGHTGELFAVAFFPDGKRIASASRDDTVRVWRAPRAENILHESEGK